ncbi:MAG: D-threitol dehydrogenase [Spirochaetales bacterium]|nr:MAG: D-threitol dehydrogenase [Spirochaetales bacterium]
MSGFNGFDENFSLANKTALITGAASGIGLAIAKMFARKEADIIAFDKSSDLSELEKYVKNKGRLFMGISGDVRDKKALQTMVDKAVNDFGRIDILVNCAGVGLIDSALELREEVWDLTMDVNVKAPFILSQMVGKTMIDKGGGKIINIASQAGIVALEKHAAYSTSKAGLIMLTKILALEWGKYNIRTNAISPTVILTEMGEKAWAGEVGERSKKLIPAGRFGHPDEVAACAVFLASDAANLINGENLVIDGGYTIT